MKPAIVDAIRSLVPTFQGAITNGIITWHVPTTAPVTQAQIDAELVRLTDLYNIDVIRTGAIDTTIAGDTTINSLKTMTNAEFDTWWTANVTTLAQANNILKRITHILLRKIA